MSTTNMTAAANIAFLFESTFFVLPFFLNEVGGRILRTPLAFSGFNLILGGRPFAEPHQPYLLSLFQS